VVLFAIGDNIRQENLELYSTVRDLTYTRPKMITLFTLCHMSSEIVTSKQQDTRSQAVARIADRTASQRTSN